MLEPIIEWLTSESFLFYNFYWIIIASIVGASISVYESIDEKLESSFKRLGVTGILLLIGSGVGTAVNLYELAPIDPFLAKILEIIMFGSVTVIIFSIFPVKRK